MTEVADVITALERHYPVRLAEDWDAVGLAVGSRGSRVTRVLYTVDVTIDIVREAVSGGADLIVAHHPLLLRPVHSVDEDTPKGQVIAELLRRHIAVYVAHTNADVPPNGVVDALAQALGLTDTRPLRPHPSSTPDTGLGRVGTLPGDLTLGQFADRVASTLPRTGGGIRVSGDVELTLRTVGVQAGAGDDLLDTARAAGADAYLTSDLRHHPASEARAWPGAPALIEVSHWAAESLWLPLALRLVGDDLAERGLGIPAVVSSVSTDPWTSRR